MKIYCYRSSNYNNNSRHYRLFHTLLNDGVKVLKEDINTGLIALYKPSGLKSHPNKSSSDTTSLLKSSCLYDYNNEYYTNNTIDKKIYLLNRLDSMTSGIILVSTNKDTAKSIKKEFAKRTITKNYKALVFGSEKVFNSNKKIKWTNNITIEHHKDKVRALSSSMNNKDNLVAISYANLDKVINNNPSILLINLQPMTGHTHQLRIQCSQNGLPIIGDKIYGNFNLNKIFNEKNTILPKRSRLFLHSYSIHLHYTLDNKQYEFQCESLLQNEPGFSSLLSS